jgi:hypothetical protein
MLISLPIFLSQSISPKRRRYWPACLRRLILLAATMLVAGCAGRITVPVGQPVTALPRFAHIAISTQGEPTEDAILAVQLDQGDATRWSLMNSLGAPLARQILENRRWRNDGFLPPNAEASKLFTALIFAWTPEAELTTRYRAKRWRADTEADGSRLRVWGKPRRPRFSVHYERGSTDTFTLVYGKNTWHVSPLPAEPK